MTEYRIAYGPPPTSLRGDLEELERLAALMDSAVRIPVIGWRVGLDGLFGLIPGLGDAASLIPAGYILYKARKFDIPHGLFARMVMNVGVDATLGAIPLIGDLFDFAFKANRRNVALLRRHIERRALIDRAGRR